MTDIWGRSVPTESESVEEGVDEVHRGPRRLGAPQEHDIDGRRDGDLFVEGGGKVGDQIALPAQQRGRILAPEFGEDELQQQLAAQVAQMAHGGCQPPVEPGATLAG